MDLLWWLREKRRGALLWWSSDDQVCGGNDEFKIPRQAQIAQAVLFCKLELKVAWHVSNPYSCFSHLSQSEDDTQAQKLSYSILYMYLLLKCLGVKTSRDGWNECYMSERPQKGNSFYDGLMLACSFWPIYNTVGRCCFEATPFVGGISKICANALARVWVYPVYSYESKMPAIDNDHMHFHHLLSLRKEVFRYYG